MIRESKYKQYGKEGLVPSCITIHNTNNYELSARQLFNYLDTDCKTSQGCHYLIDHEEVIEVMPLNWKVWHTGKGNDYAFHHSIAIEVCSNLNDDLYLEGQTKAIELIKNLMNEYSLTKEDIYFHNDWNQLVYCPSTILRMYGNKKEFLKLLEEEND